MIGSRATTAGEEAASGLGTATSANIAGDGPPCGATDEQEAPKVKPLSRAELLRALLDDNPFDLLEMNSLSRADAFRMTTETLTEARRRLSRKLHPDKGGCKEALVAMRRACDAIEMARSGEQGLRGLAREDPNPRRKRQVPRFGGGEILGPPSRPKGTGS